MDGAVLVYDDDCGFCTWWARYFDRRTPVAIIGFAELDDAIRERLPADYEACSHVVTPDRVYSCGASIEEVVCRTGWGSPLRPFVERLRGLGTYRALREWGYRRVADNRGRWGRLVSRPPPARTDEERRDT